VRPVPALKRQGYSYAIGPAPGRRCVASAALALHGAATSRI